MKVCVDISAYWPLDKHGHPASVNFVYTQYIGTNNKLNYQTLVLAKCGRLESGKFANLVKLARVCSDLSGQEVGVEDLIFERD